MEKLFYPAVFHTAEEGGYWVEFPDIPEWMNEEALALNINFSQVLQDALVEKINAKDSM